MADVPTAAFDPVFWVHHSNIDRLWVMWACTPGKSWGALPDSDWFDEKPWFFHDFDLTVKNEPRRHYMEHLLLGIRYSPEESKCQPLALPELVASTTTEDDGLHEGIPLHNEGIPLKKMEHILIPKVLFDAHVVLEASALKGTSKKLDNKSTAAVVDGVKTAMLPRLAGTRIVLELSGIV